MLYKKFERIFLWTMIAAIFIVIYTCLYFYTQGSIDANTIGIISSILIFTLPVYFFIIRPITIAFTLFKTRKYIKTKQTATAYEYIKKQFNKNSITLFKFIYMLLSAQMLDFDTFYYLYSLNKPKNINSIVATKVVVDFLSGKEVNKAELESQMLYDRDMLLFKIKYLVNEQYKECLETVITSQSSSHIYLSARCDKIAKQKLGQDFSHEDEIINNYEKDKHHSDVKTL